MKQPFPFEFTAEIDDERFMKEALKEAWAAYCKKEVPIGAVLVKHGRVIARGHNQVEMLCDATAHAEMLCLTAGEAAVGNWRLAETTLYCTVEPCSMCAGAMLLTRVPRLVWGAPDIRHGAHGSWVNLLDQEHPTHDIDVEKNVCGEISAELMRRFFREQRQERGSGE